MSIKNILTWHYWFSQPYTAIGLVFKIWLGGFLAIVLVGLMALIIRRKKTMEAERKAWGRLGACLLTMGILGLIWLWLRQQSAFFLAWRFWLLLWLVLFLVWFIKILWYMAWRLPKVRAQNKERETKEKYL